jgi:hypothetical protein
MRFRIESFRYVRTDSWARKKRGRLHLVRPPTYVWIAGGALLIGAGALIVEALTSKKPRRIALIGDSLAVGLTGPLGSLAAAAGVPFQGQGVVSTTPAQWTSGAAACGPCGNWVAGFSPSATLCVLGTNDIGYSPSPPVAPYQAIARKFPNVIWVMPPIMPNDRLAGVRSVIASLGVPTIPAMTGLSFGADQIHPLNYAPWAAWIWGQLP